MILPPKLKLNFVQRILVGLSNTPRVVLATAQTELGFCILLSLTILIPSGMAFASGYLNARAWTQDSGTALIVGVVCAAFILVLDAALVGTFRKHMGGAGKYVGIGLRCVGGGALGVLLSHTLILEAFGGRIEKYAREKNATAITALKAGAITTEQEMIRGRAAETEPLKVRVAGLRTELQRAAAEQERKEGELLEWKRKADDEDEGLRASKAAGKGPRYREALAKIDPQERDLAALRLQQAAWRDELASIERKIADKVVGLSDSADLRKERAATEQDVEALRAQRFNDISSRDALLGELEQQDPSVRWKRLILMLALLALDLSALAMKLFAPWSPLDDEYSRISHVSSARAHASIKAAYVIETARAQSLIRQEVQRLEVEAQLSHPSAILAGFSQLMDEVSTGREKLAASIESISESTARDAHATSPDVEALIRHAQTVFFETADHVLRQFRENLYAPIAHPFGMPSPSDVNSDSPSSNVNDGIDPSVLAA